MRLVEPVALTRFRMLRNRLTDLPGAQTIAGLPFEFELGVAACVFDLRPAVGLDHFPPWQVDTFAVIPHVHGLGTRKTVGDFRVDRGRHLPTVANRRLTS